MHIVDVTMFYAGESGGVKRYLGAKQLWLRSLARHRHTLLVPGARDHVNDALDTVTIRSPRLPFGNGYRLPVGQRNWAHHLRALRPDLIEVGDPYRLAWIAQRVGWESDIPVVGFYHSDLPRLVAMRFGPLAARVAERYVGDLYARFDLVLAPSRTMVERLWALGVSQARQQRLGVDTACFSPVRRDPDLRAELGLPTGCRLLIYVGRFSREKNLPLLMAAMRRLGKGYRLLLVGSGNNLPEQDNVHCLPYEPTPARLARLLASCDALVHPGDKETFGLIVLEAMACALPVVGMDAGGVAELVDAEVGLLARPGSTEALAEAIAGLFERDREALRARARARAEAYAWDSVLAQLVEHYEGLTLHRGSGEGIGPAAPALSMGTYGDTPRND